MFIGGIRRGDSLADAGDLTFVKAEAEGRPNGRSILFVHGMWCGDWVWRNYLGFFAACGYTCCALNLRGHHGSRPVPDVGKVSVYDYIADVQQVARHMGNPILVGHSMGGLIVQKLAERMDPPAAVLITPGAPRGIFALSTPDLLRTAARHAREIALGAPLSLDPAESGRLLFNRFAAHEQPSWHARLVPESGRATREVAILGVTVDASKLKCPMLVIGASQDNITPARMVAKIARRYRAEHLEYARSAHMLIVETGWERMAEDIRPWLERLSRHRTSAAKRIARSDSP
ncbi:MAG: alpha/beta hydrolase [Gammaproteobacteria bacterium]